VADVLEIREPTAAFEQLEERDDVGLAQARSLLEAIGSGVPEAALA
jgi:hypothetical protein